MHCACRRSQPTTAELTPRARIFVMAGVTAWDVLHVYMNANSVIGHYLR